MSATETVSVPEPLEAVIISGPRKGQIIRLPDEAPVEYSHEEVQALNDALDKLDAALQRLSAQIRETTKSFQIQTEAA